MLVTTALNTKDGSNPARRHAEAIGGLLDQFGEPIDGFGTRRGLRGRARLEERRGRGLTNERRDRQDDACDESEGAEPCNRTRQLTDMTLQLQTARIAYPSYVRARFRMV